MRSNQSIFHGPRRSSTSISVRGSIFGIAQILTTSDWYSSESAMPMAYENPHRLTRSLRQDYIAPGVVGVEGPRETPGVRRHRLRIAPGDEPLVRGTARKSLFTNESERSLERARRAGSDSWMPGSQSLISVISCSDAQILTSLSPSVLSCKAGDVGRQILAGSRR